MSTNILDEYLVKLGAVVDQAGLNRFNAALDAVRKNTEWGAAAMARSMGTAAKEIIVGLAAIGAATVGLLDHVANADQSYRLLGLHMFMTKDAARSLKITMDALGESLDNITWDPELAKRASQLFEDQRRMAPSGDFDGQMKKIRDIRFQFTRMEVEMQYLTMHVAQDLMKAFGMGPGDLDAKLKVFNKWVQTHLPEISHKIVTTIVPAIKEFWEWMKSCEGGLKAFASSFTGLVGTLEGDQTLQGQTFSWKLFGTAIKDVAVDFGKAAIAIGGSVKDLMDITNEALYGLKAYAEFLIPGKQMQAIEDAQIALYGNHPAQATDPSLPSYLPPPSAKGAPTPEAALHTDIQLNNKLPGMKVGFGLATHTLAAWNRLHKVTWKAFEAAMGNALRTPLMMVPTPGLMGALGSVESGGTKNPDTAVSSSGAIGRYQLMPGTAKMLGVDPWDPAQNKAGAYKYMSQLLKKYHGDVAHAVGAYHSGPGNIDAALAGKATLGPEGRGEISKVLGRMNRGSSVTVDTINVHITEPHATKEHIQMAVAHGVREGVEKQTQRNLAEWDTLGWGYGQ